MQAGEPPPPRPWIKNTKSNKSNLESDGIRVFCYNILAESYATIERLNYCPSWALAWEYRKHRLLSEITQNEPDIICLQEVEAEQYSVFFHPQISIRGYKGIFHSKSRARTMDQYSSRNVDGCCIFWKEELFDCVFEELIEYQSLALKKFEMVGQQGMNRLMTKDNIAIVVILKPKGTLKINSEAEVDQLMVVNTHIHWDPACEDVKVMQVQMLTEKIEQIDKAHRSPCGRSIPMVMCGDFNSVIDSAVYTLLSTKEVLGDHQDLGQYDYGHYSKHGLKHSMELQSSYHTVCGQEPPFTNYTGDFIGVLDYIWYTEDSLSAEQVIQTFSEEVVLSHNGALPNPYVCSDHVYLCADIFGKIKRGIDYRYDGAVGVSNNSNSVSQVTAVNDGEDDGGISQTFNFNNNLNNPNNNNNNSNNNNNKNDNFCLDS